MAEQRSACGLGGTLIITVTAASSVFARFDALAALITLGVTLVVWRCVPVSWWRVTAGRFTGAWVVVIAVLLVGIATWRWQRLPIVDVEGWWPTSPAVIDRWTSPGLPRIAPGVLDPSRPQRLWIRTDPTVKDLLVEACGQQWHPVALGSGLWYWHHDGWPLSADHVSGPTKIMLHADGVAVDRQLQLRVPVFRPHAVAADSDRGLAIVVSRDTDQAVIIDREGGLQYLPVGDGPTACAITNQLHPAQAMAVVVHAFEPMVKVFDLATASASWRCAIPPHATACALDPTGTRLAILHDGAVSTVSILDLSRQAVIDVFSLNARADRVCFGRHSDELILHVRRGARLHIYRKEAAQWSQHHQVSLGRPWRGMVREPDGAGIWGSSSGVATAIQDLLGNHQVEHHLVRYDLLDQRLSQPIDIEARTARQQRPGDADSGLDPGAITWIAGRLAVACTGSREVLEINTDQLLQPWRRHRLPPSVVRIPGALADLGDGYRIITDPAGGGVVVTDGDHSKYILHAEAGTDDQLATSDPLALTWRRGESVFHAATRSGMSCQSCHLEGDTDDGLHAIGDHASYTLSVRGLSGTKPYLHGGTYRDGADLHRRVGIGLGGGYWTVEATNGGADLDAWLDSLAAPVNPHWASVDHQHLVRGWQIFQQSGCISCHQPPSLTDRSWHLEGELFPDRRSHPQFMLDTPSLLGRWRRPRWLRDGRAESLSAVLGERNVADEHGATSALSPAERSDLLIFLKAL